MDFTDIYNSKKKSPEEIADQILSGFELVCPTAASQPTAIPAAIAERAKKGEIEHVRHNSIIALNPAPFVDPELAGKFEYVSWFTQAAARKGVQEGYCDYMPCHYSEEVAVWDAKGNPDVFYAVVSPMDRHGYFSFGIIASEAVELAERAKYVFLEVNKNMPRCHGSNIIHISQVDALCEYDAPLNEVPVPTVSETDLTIGRQIAEMIPDGATIQFGIGGVPSAVGMCLNDKKDLGIHTELFTESMIDLIEQGIVTNRRKPLNTGKTVAAFAWGSKRMYDFLDDNISISMEPVSYVNNPYVIGQIDNFISINACLEVDLLGQVCSESIGPKHFSGSGGQVDFVRGCNMSKGGKSFIAMNATAKKGTLSKIKPILTPGAVVTTGKNDVDYIVTEFGVAHLRGRTAGERAKALIEIAHPDFREELRAEARKMHLMI
ncbi:MAG: acetyl-CoA hydrolase/transferase C-terminal domain-containing protein [Eubacteriales bacterium]|nr:acetyl-CoA hydrolase/transferase C-terminal domain-containing protein [Eubacteriales bacterium]